MAGDKAPKSGGGLGKILGKLHDEIFEDDGKSKTAPAPTPAPLLTPQPQAYAQPASPTYFVPPPATMPPAFAAGAAPSAPAFAIPTAEPVDPDAMALVQSQALPETINGHVSRYVLFQRMWEALGKPSDPAGVLNALAVTDKSVTAASVLEDLNAHLALLDAYHAKAESDINSYAEQTLGQTDAQIKALQDANDNATKEIQRHQQEMSDRITQITQLQQQRAESEAKIARGRQRGITAEGALRSQLQQAQQNLSR